MSQAAMAELQAEQAPCFESQFHKDVLEGLNSATKTLAPKYFYDEKGSHYFDEICTLDEYYPYRTELDLLPKVAQSLAKKFIKPVSIVEFGAGSLIKIRPLLEEISSVCEFTPIDISGEHLSQAAARLKPMFPGVQICPVQADFCSPVALKSFRGERLGFFPGSTIGNFSPDQACSFLKSARETLGNEAHMLIGVDTKKSPEVLHHAYNDSEGVTAKFNLNILERINRELDANIKTDNFEHYAHYNPQEGRIEMHLVSTCDQNMRIGQANIRIDDGESIHTECSYKYTPSEFRELAEQAHWRVEESWLAEGNMFSMYLLKAGN